MNEDEGDPGVDWAGTRHVPAGPSARIACVVPSITETLFALGLGDRVVARTGFCVHPHDAVRAVPRIGGTKDFDLQRLRELRPTHLIVNIDENRREVVDRAREFVPGIVVTHPLRPEDNRRLFGLLGAIFGCAAAADALAGRFDRALAYLQRRADDLPRERVLYLIWRKPWMTVARDTYIAATLRSAGFDTVPERCEQRYPALSDDDAVWRKAQRILLSSEPYAFRARDVEELQSRVGRPVMLIDGEWTSWYGVRAIDGLRALARWRERPKVSRGDRREA